MCHNAGSLPHCHSLARLFRNFYRGVFTFENTIVFWFCTPGLSAGCEARLYDTHASMKKQKYLFVRGGLGRSNRKLKLDKLT
jgi:hypothetical protein